ncbi:HAMP domain-containing sensor histidine kinase [Coraliomargarita sp. SDUM461004]|uniref:histidine kinase n=1 Tax=Thalassobacterium sedimentorum TaxID=3041258 RepID=A0ABU1AQ14_9BACT|nr:HAMP domain-containing sensor histidine kinase [Coraliomargarita sp. SDUM461004]MDQ8195846.1 HAMP domain-containing sensor histidine kinase [Coraliomargarita sp. SDUM461004]
MPFTSLNFLKNWSYLCLFLGALATSPLEAISHDQLKREPLTGTWHYRWGDSPIINGVPEWTQDSDKLAWMPIGFPSDPPFREGQNNVWYRYDLPETKLPGHSLFILSVDLLVEVYLEAERIYTYGNFAEDGSGNFQGWPWHLIQLPHNSSGKSLYFRVYSDYSDIGLWGDISLGSEYAHLQHMIRQDLLPITLGLALIVGGIAMLGSTMFCWRIPVLTLGVFLINLGCIPITESQIKQLILFHPILWQFFAAGCYFSLPITMAAFIHALYGKGRYYCYQLVWMAHLIFLLLAIGLSLTGSTNLSSFYLYFDTLALITLFVLSITLTVAAIDGNTDQRIIAGSFWLFYIVMLYNGLTAHGILPFAPRREYLGPLLLGICFLIILIRRYTNLNLEFKNRSLQLETINTNLEQIVKERTTALQTLNRTKDQFFTIIAHDMKSPVGALLHLMQDYEYKRTGIPAKDVPELRDNCQKTYDLLTRLLTWARGQQGQLHPNKQKLDLRSLVQKTLNELRPQAVAKHIELQFSFEGTPLLSADIDMLAATLRNLVNNAIKFTPPGGWVKVAIRTIPNARHFTITDNGIGLPEDEIDNLFLPKEYGSIRTDTTGKKGSGLGLLLCKEFIDAHSGTLYAEIPEEGGARFGFILPELDTNHLAESLEPRRKSTV